jgi:hypothetical protein
LCIRIAATERHLNDRLGAAAAIAPLRPESIEALHHEQPTPRSLASALAALGVASPESAKIIGTAMTQAKRADEARNVAAWERALARIDRTIGPWGDRIGRLMCLPRLPTRFHFQEPFFVGA